ncbi:MAG: hypothetical protein OXI96_10565 [Acidimicrobiaceae bacterium]|nr:hypothetical protein [Acidimicrobiaceae bacterium]
MMRIPERAIAETAAFFSFIMRQTMRIPERFGRIDIRHFLGFAVLILSGCVGSNDFAETLDELAAELNGNDTSSSTVDDDSNRTSGTSDPLIDEDAEKGSKAESLIEAAIEHFTKQSVSGETIIHMGNNTALEQSSTAEYKFSQDAEGSVSIRRRTDTSLPSTSTGDEQLPEAERISGVIEEFRYIDGTAYIQIPTSLAEEKGIDTSKIKSHFIWASIDADREKILGLAKEYPIQLLCNFPQLDVQPNTPTNNTGCYPMLHTVSIISKAEEIEIVQEKEEIRGIPTTRLSLKIPFEDIHYSDVDTAQNTNILSWFISEETLNDIESLSLENLVTIFRETVNNIITSVHNLSLTELAVALKETVSKLLDHDLDINIDAEVWIDQEMRIRRFSYNLGFLLESLEDMGSDIIEVLADSAVEDKPDNALPIHHIVIDYHDHGGLSAIRKPPSELTLGDYTLLGF